MNKGFTLVELLATIVIVGILSIMAIAGISGLINKSRIESEKQYKRALKMAAESYYQTNKTKLPKNVGEHNYITSTKLKEKRYLKEDKGGCVEVYKTTNIKYTYKVKDRCTKSEACNPQPVIEELSFIKGDRLMDSILHLKINGGKNSNNEQVQIVGYSYSIYVKTHETDEYREVYNSGTLSVYNKTEITVNKKISEYIDETATNYVAAKVKVFNKEGCENVKGTDPSIISDTEKPICGKISGEAKNENDWIKKSKDTRVITVACEQGRGSACLRSSFTRTWPNDTETSAEFGYIEIRNNAGNKESCKVRVNVDMELPTITVKSSALKANVVADDNNSTVSIDSNNYKNTVSGWINKANYANGLEFNVSLSDNIRLASYKWETNGSNDEQQSGKLNEKTKSLTIKLFKNGKSRTGTLTVKDKAGNATVVNISAKIDTVVPTCGDKTGGATKWENVASRKVGVKCSDSTSGCISDEFTSTVKNEVEKKSVTIEIKDNAGNTNSCTNKYNIRIDRTPPTCGSPTGGSTKWSHADSRKVGVECEDGLSKCSKDKFTKSVTDEAKTKSVTIKIKDNAKNETDCKNTYNIYLDRTAPTIYDGSGDKYAAYNSHYNVNEWGFKIKDNLSGLATISSPQQGVSGPSLIYYCYGNCSSGCQKYEHDSNTHKLGKNLPKVLTDKDIYPYWLRKAQIADNVDGINQKDRILMQTNVACNGGRYLVRSANKICDIAGNCKWQEINYDFR